MKPRATQAIHFSSASSEWYTPPVIIERVVCCLGAIDLDPASNSPVTPIVPAAHHFTREDDGLAQVWCGRIFLNPPYGRGIGRWLIKLCAEYGSGRVTAAIALVPARTDTAWFRLLRDYPICFVAGRLCFSGHANSAPFPSALAYLGKEPDRFSAVFGDLGDIRPSAISRSRRVHQSWPSTPDGSAPQRPAVSMGNSG